MDTRPVFLLVTATTCGACVHFKKGVWKSGDRTGYREVLSKNPSIRLIEIEVPNTATAPDASLYPASLAKWIRWYPTMFLFTGSSWNNALPKSKKGSGELEGVILNGEMINGQVRSQQGARDPASISKWITDTITTNPIFTGKPNPTPLVSQNSTSAPAIPSVASNVNSHSLRTGAQVPDGMIPTIGQIRYQDREIDSSYDR